MFLAQNKIIFFYLLGLLFRNNTVVVFVLTALKIEISTRVKKCSFLVTYDLYISLYGRLKSFFYFY